jgi:hypothetical protein
MRKIWNWILKELIIDITIKPTIGVYDVRLGWIWVIYFTIKLLSNIFYFIDHL